eukprot:1142908-Pelagomonas_calceolata.AAC.1
MLWAFLIYSKEHQGVYSVLIIFAASTKVAHSLLRQDVSNAFKVVWGMKIIVRDYRSGKWASSVSSLSIPPWPQSLSARAVPLKHTELFCLARASCAHLLSRSPWLHSIVRRYCWRATQAQGTVEVRAKSVQHVNTGPLNVVVGQTVLSK